MLTGRKARRRGKAEETVIPGLLRPLDTKALAKELRLESRASERGAKNLPAADEVGFDAVEQEITHRLMSEWAWQFDQLLSVLRTYRDRLALVSVSARIGQLRLLARNALAQFQNADRVAQGRLGFLRQGYLAARRELETFMRRHRIDRPARPKANPVLTWGLLIFLIAIESALNGVFFSRGSEFGLIGGVVTAVGISAANVLAAFLLGLFPARWLNHRRALAKLSGLALTICGLGGLIALHLFAAHFREAMLHGEEAQAFATALQTLRTNPAGLSDINSWYLFGLGSLFALSSFWKGYNTDDPYPGYGSIARRARAAEFGYRSAHERFFGELGRVKDETIGQLREALRGLPENVREVEQIRAARAELIERFSVYEPQIESAANHLLSVYREANRRRRRTEPPEHFAASWNFTNRARQRPEVAALLADPDTIDEMKMKTILEELRTLSREVLEAYEALLVRFEHPTEMT